MRNKQMKYLCSVGFSLLVSVLAQAQDNGGCDDCPAFNAHGKVKVKGVKERIIGDLSQPIALRVRTLLSQMTLQEKIAQLVNESDSISRLNLPAYDYWNECLHGVARAGKVTVFPQAINLASTWDADLVKKVATAISTEARLKYLEIGKGLTYWSPTINMARDPRWGRNEETYGEDPYLTSRMGVSFVKGLQGDHPNYLKTIATVKHFVANNEENNRFSSSSQIPTKQLYEYYFPAYEACVKEANVQSVMTAYNAINGTPSSASHWLLEEVLRKEWGFKGFVVSDCGAIGVINWQHRAVNSLAEAAALAISNGCDLECGKAYKESLFEAVKKGLVTEAVLDKALERVLTARFKLGEFDPMVMVPYNHYDQSLLGGEKFRELSYEAAVKSIVLLKNDTFLPIDKEKIKSVAIIGPFAENNYLGGYSGQPFRNISLVQGVTDLLGTDVKISYMQGTDVISPIERDYLLDVDKKVNGITAQYFNNTDFSGEPLFSRRDANVGFEWGDESPDSRLLKDNFAVRWTGFLKAPVTGERAVGLYADGGVRMWINNKLVINQWESEGLQYYSVNVPFSSKQLISIKIEYVDRTGAAACFLVSDFGNSARMKKVIDFASKADLVLVALGNDEKLARENRDLPSIYLPLTQETMLKEIYKANPKTALILHTGNPLTSTWADKHIPAIIQAGYPGQEGGRALADILFGKQNPSGKLPITIYQDEKQLPPLLDYDITKGRTYQYLKSSALYPFGHGLSYSDFEFTHPVATENLCAGDSLCCSVKVTNISKRKGEEVVQVYISRENTPVYTFPLKKLVAFERVMLEPGETKELKFQIAPRQLSIWNEGSWKVLTGKYQLFMGGGQPGLSKGVQVEYSVVAH